MTAVPRVCVVGPLVGHAGLAPAQAEKLADLLTTDGYPIVAFSSQVNRYVRLADIVLNLLKHGRDVDVTLLEVYGGGRSFVVEDIASRLAKRFGHRLVMTLHGGAFPDFAARHPYWVRAVLDRADALVTPSEFLARFLRTQGRAVVVIPNVIELQHYPFRHRERLEPRLWWMRSFHDVYNPEMALEALARVRARGRDCTLVMSGPDKGRAQDVAAAARRLGVESFVRFTGFLEMAGKAHEGNAADIFINTSRVDNMPVAIIEAAAMGLPVVSTAIGGVPDLVADGETALLVADGDAAAMADAIVRLLDDADLASRLSANGRRLAERSSWPQVGPLWERVIGSSARVEPRHEGIGRECTD